MTDTTSPTAEAREILAEACARSGETSVARMLREGHEILVESDDAIDAISRLLSRPTAAPDGAEHPWTERLAHIAKRTRIERQAAGLVGLIECMGGHPLLTEAQNYADRALRTLGAWTDQGEPGSAYKRSFPDAADGAEPSDLAVELWAAGADHETAGFVARMLTDKGFVLSRAALSTARASAAAPDGAEVESMEMALDMQALAEAVHNGRFNGPVTTPFCEESEGGRLYCMRIANSVALHLAASPPIERARVERETIEVLCLAANRLNAIAVDAIAKGDSRRFEYSEWADAADAAALRALPVTPAGEE